jgi:hypothetical protein
MIALFALRNGRRANSMHRSEINLTVMQTPIPVFQMVSFNLALLRLRHALLHLLTAGCGTSPT